MYIYKHFFDVGMGSLDAFDVATGHAQISHGAWNSA